jgi:hypothetical protein
MPRHLATTPDTRVLPPVPTGRRRAGALAPMQFAPVAPLPATSHVVGQYDLTLDAQGGLQEARGWTL